MNAYLEVRCVGELRKGQSQHGEVYLRLVHTPKKEETVIP